jgi:SAM-dependent methyltransferase
MSVNGPAPSPPAAFDALAASYDDTFTGSTLGGLLRGRVWRHLDRAFEPGDRVLDIGCGTAEDAVHLAGRGVRVIATDASAEMTEVALAKVAGAGLDHRVEVRNVAAERLGDAFADTPPFDGVLSNFGVLNCVETLRSVADQVSACTRPGAPVFLCVMGPVVPWEWGWHLARGRPGTAFRRLRPGGAVWRGMRVRYPSIGATSRAFQEGFRRASVRAIGVLLPPTYSEGWARRHPRLLARLAELEERIEAAPPFPWLADHYLLELVRR